MNSLSTCSAPLSSEQIPELLERLKISFEWHEHEAVFSVTEAATLSHLSGTPTKNLFLRDKNGTQEFLVVVPDCKRVDLKAFAEQIQSSKLSFASPERLHHSLGVSPGAVSYLCILNSSAQRVQLVVDSEIWDAASVQCHPLRNTATVIIRQPALSALAQHSGHTAIVMKVASVASCT